MNLFGVGIIFILSISLDFTVGRNIISNLPNTNRAEQTIPGNDTDIITKLDFRNMNPTVQVSTTNMQTLTKSVALKNAKNLMDTQLLNSETEMNPRKIHSTKEGGHSTVIDHKKTLDSIDIRRFNGSIRRDMETTKRRKRRTRTTTTKPTEATTGTGTKTAEETAKETATETTSETAAATTRIRRRKTRSTRPPTTTEMATTRRRRTRSTTPPTTTTTTTTTKRTTTTTPKLTTRAPIFGTVNVDIIDEGTTTFRIWTTSEDSLQRLLKQKLAYVHPAPDQVGQLDKGLMMPVTRPLWRFEEYDDTSSKIKSLREDRMKCEAQKVRCLEDTEYNQPVCVEDLSVNDKTIPLFARSKGFDSLCEVDYRNCLKRYELTGKYYADSYQEDYLEFLHYGWCDICKNFPRGTCEPKSEWYYNY